MKISFSTLACPDWTFKDIVGIATRCGYNGIELRFVEDEGSLWKLNDFRADGLPETRRLLRNSGLTIPCIDTGCQFHFPDVNERRKWIEEGERMAEVAAELNSPGIRVFGDRIQLGADRYSTRKWIAESIADLSERIRNRNVAVWLETHGDFASAFETSAILGSAGVDNIGVIWDPANCWLEFNDSPEQAAAEMATSIRHVHVKDIRKNASAGQHVLTGEGNFPLQELQVALDNINYHGFLSFEWEKKWHPEIPDAHIALPHFVKWFRENWNAG
jgi:sugar phosphate isomerase/epimerase